MVTFSTDYWAPAMEVNVRRRTEKSPLHNLHLNHSTSSSSSGGGLTSHSNNSSSNDDHWNTLRQVPTVDSSDSSLNGADPPTFFRRSFYGNSNSNNSNSNSNSNNSNSHSTSGQNKPAPVSVPSRKLTLIHKLFHNDPNKTNSTSPPASPDYQQQHHMMDQEDPYLWATHSSPSLDKKNLFNLAHALGRNPNSAFGTDRQSGGALGGSPGHLGLSHYNHYYGGGVSGVNGGGGGHGSGLLPEILPNGVRRGAGPAIDCSLLKKYGICEKGNIGQGATAVVRLAHKLSDKEDEPEKLFAVKEFRKRRKNETEKEYVKKLTSEFCISSTLHHENVVETVDLVQDEHHHWCEVMEYCSGGDLYNVIKAGKMSRVEVDCCFKQLLTGIGYLHSMGVAHRDIKPENLLLDSSGRLKITDFGVSDVFRMCWEKTPHLSKGLCGSEPYIAPEEFKAKEYDARRVDIWACGIVYYCMVYTGIPFRAATDQDSNYQHFVEMRAVNNYEPFEKLNLGCRKLLKKILDPNPETRITIEEIMQDEWFKSIECCAHGENQNPHRHF